MAAATLVTAPGLFSLPPGRAAAARGRQAALWRRARRLRHRLRVVGARQVERHVRHQLAGLARSLRRAGPGDLPPVLRHDLRLLAAAATARLRAAQRGCDSDATGSSSGSGGESEEDGAGQQRPASGSPRRGAERQWVVERAAIICRWTWLQAQVSQLEYRIRQQTRIYRRLRAAKGPVILDGERRPGGLMKKQGQPGSVALVTFKKNQWLLPSSSVPRCPIGSLHCCPLFSSQSSPLTRSLGIPLCPRPSCSPTSGSPAPFRVCTTAPCRGNRVLNCLPPSSSRSSSLVGGKAEGRFGQPTPQNPPARLDETCVAARIRPVRTWWRRQLVWAASGSHCSRKPPRPLPVRCSCEWPSSCILCSCRVSLQTIDPDTMSLAERIALLDSGFHPVLSLSQGNPLHLLFETLLREEGLQGHRVRTLKMSNFGKKEDPTSSAFPKPHSPLLLASHKSGSLCEGRRQPKGTSSHSFPVPSPQAHKYGPLHHPLFLYPETPALPASQTPSTASSALSSERRKAGCSYDSDNIVIPMSIAAAAQVEKPQHKEIVVPSWRIAELKDLGPYNQVDSELEDTSDEMYSSHHSKCEDLERAHWDSWAAATSQRQGSRSHRRRSSNKAEGGWARQPQPASPAAGSNCLDDLYVVSSPGLHSPETCSSLWSRSAHDGTRVVLPCSEDTRSSLEIQEVQPWEPRTFPLSDSAYQGLLQHSEEDGCDQADLPPWVSSKKQSIRPTSAEGSQFSDTHLKTGSKTSTEGFMVQQRSPGQLVSNAQPRLWCV